MSEWQEDWIKGTEAQFLLMDRQFCETQAKIRDEAIKHGALNSSGVGLALYQSLDAEVAARTMLLQDEFKQAIEGVQILTLEELSGAGLRAIDSLRTTAKHIRSQTNVDSYLANFKLQKIEEDTNLNLEKMIELLTVKIPRIGATELIKRSKGDGHSTNVAIHGDGNVVQAGIYKSTVGLKLHSEQVKSLTLAIQQFRDEIERSTMPTDAKAELIEVVVDCEKEIEKPQPNRLKLSGMLGGVATAVQTAASLAPAWAAFKAAANAVGIPIP